MKARIAEAQTRLEKARQMIVYWEAKNNQKAVQNWRMEVSKLESFIYRMQHGKVG